MGLRVLMRPCVYPHNVLHVCRRHACIGQIRPPALHVQLTASEASDKADNLFGLRGPPQDEPDEAKNQGYA
jgi:hypothetical protein